MPGDNLFEDAEAAAARLYVYNVSSDRQEVREWAPRYQESRGRPLYENRHLENRFPVPLPANAAVALVHFDCDSCHAFMAATNYPTETPDHRPIVYIDLNNPEGRAYYRQLGLSGNVPAEPLKLNGRDVPYNSQPSVPTLLFPILLNVNAQSQIDRALSVGVEDGMRFFGDGTQRTQTPSQAEIPNRDIPGETSPQTNYMTLTAQQKDLVDRAICSEVIAPHRPGQRYQFSPSIIDQFHGQPDSKQIEEEIERRREDYATRLLGGDTALATRLATAARTASIADMSPSAALNLIIAFNGDECGCTFAPPPTVNLDEVLAPLNHRANPPTQTPAQRH